MVTNSLAFVSLRSLDKLRIAITEDMHLSIRAIVGEFRVCKGQLHPSSIIASMEAVTKRIYLPFYYF